MPRAYFDSTGPLSFAHRGGAALWPENTLEAFEGGLAAGCDYIETDVHMTRDGALVLFHDARVERTTDSKGLIRNMSLREVKALDAGYHFRDLEGGLSFRGKGLRVPTLAELAQLSSRVKINVEIKQADPPMIHALLAEIDRLQLHDRILVASARTAIVQAFRRAAQGRVPTSAGTSEIAKFWAALHTKCTRWLRIDYEALQVPVTHKGLRVTTRAFVDAAHARGLQVHVWTIDDPAQMRSLLALGVDGLMSDRPDLLTKVLSSASAERS